MKLGTYVWARNAFASSWLVLEQERDDEQNGPVRREDAERAVDEVRPQPGQRYAADHRGYVRPEEEKAAQYEEERHPGLQGVRDLHSRAERRRAGPRRGAEIDVVDDDRERRHGPHSLDACKPASPGHHSRPILAIPASGETRPTASPFSPHGWKIGTAATLRRSRSMRGRVASPQSRQA
jgi:hypothetical protein